MKQLKKLYLLCKDSDSIFLIVILRTLYYKLFGKNIIPHHKVIIRGKKNIITKERLFVGVANNDFTLGSDKTYLHIKGSMIVEKDFHIGRGCKFAVGPKGKVILGRSMVNAYSTFIINHKLKIGNYCVISWNCQFLDDDLHTIQYDNKKEKNPNINIGNNIWIGSNVSVFKGVSIPDGCIVAANSVLVSSFQKKNCLIAGNPAKVIKQNVSWS